MAKAGGPKRALSVLLPKASGTLRPITLLTVNDKIVYQAFVNVIAEALKKKTGRRYETSVFAHLYAGKSSAFFYKKWQTSYRNFGHKLSDAHSRGYIYIADFDLTAFYGSIDRHFLKELGIDEDTAGSPLGDLSTATSTNSAEISSKLSMSSKQGWCPEALIIGFQTYPRPPSLRYHPHHLIRLKGASRGVREAG